MTKEELIHDLFHAYFEARKHKRNTVNQLRFELNYERNLMTLADEILGRQYQLRASICFVVFKPVKREIFAADFRDRVVHHLIYNYINPIFEDMFIDDSYSCRKGRGTHYGANRVSEFIQKCSDNYTKDCYILKLDLQGYFMSINREKLFSILQSILYKAIASGRYETCRDNIDMIIYLIKVVLADNPTTHCVFKGHKTDWDDMPKSKSMFSLWLFYQWLEKV